MRAFIGAGRLQPNEWPRPEPWRGAAIKIAGDGRNSIGSAFFAVGVPARQQPQILRLASSMISFCDEHDRVEHVGAALDGAYRG
jgi:hypothetical protein